MRIVALSLAVLAMSATTRTSGAGSVHLSPTTVTIRAGEPTGSFLIENQGTTPITFSAAAFEWKHTPAGEIALQRTDDLILFPTRIDLGAGQTRGVRVGTRVWADTTERAYSVFNTSPTDSTGTVFYQCTAGVLVRVELSRGSSSTFDPRTLTNGAQILNYNLYLDSSHTTIWGDGTGTTGRISQVVTALFQHSATVFGRIPAQQDVTTGGYSDSVTASIIF